MKQRVSAEPFQWVEVVTFLMMIQWDVTVHISYIFIPQCVYRYRLKSVHIGSSELDNTGILVKRSMSDLTSFQSVLECVVRPARGSVSSTRGRITAPLTASRLRSLLTRRPSASEPPGVCLRLLSLSLSLQSAWGHPLGPGRQRPRLLTKASLSDDLLPSPTPGPECALVFLAGCVPSSPIRTLPYSTSKDAFWLQQPQALRSSDARRPWLTSAY